MQKLDVKSVVGPLKNSRQLVMSVFLGLALFLLWQFLVSPQYNTYSSVRVSAKNTQTQLNDINKDLQQIDALQKSIEDVEASDLDKLNKTLPYGENLEEFLSNMHKLAQQSGLVIVNMYVKPVDATVGSTGEVRSSDLSMSLKGTYSDFLDFIRSLERHTRLVDVRTLDVAGSNAPKSVNRKESLTINLSATVYWLDSVPKSPLFPYGQTLSTSLFETEQFRALQVLTSSLSVDGPSEPNPFAPQ